MPSHNDNKGYKEGSEEPERAERILFCMGEQRRSLGRLRRAWAG